MAVVIIIEPKLITIIPNQKWHDVSDRAKKSIIRFGLQAYKGNLTLQETNQQHG